MSELPPAIEVTGLRKTYGDREAVGGIDLRIEQGEVFALLGPNGAGKTTTVEILEGFRDRSGGAVTVLGADPGSHDPAFKERIGVVLQTTGIDPYLTVGEVLDRFRGFYRAPRQADELLDLVGLAEQRDQRVKQLSGGQQRRLDVAVGLAGDPDLLFLDEPTTGFDPAARRQAWSMIENLKALGKTVLLTTHYMEEAQILADRVAVLVRGEIVAEGRPDELGTGVEGTTVISVRTPTPPPAIGGAEQVGERWEFVASDPVPVLAELTAWALDGGHELLGLEVRHRSLEDVYLDLTASGEDETLSAPDDVRNRRRRGRRR